MIIHVKKNRPRVNPYVSIRVFCETMSRSEASVSPFILRSAAAVCSSASELTETLPTNNRPHPYPSLPLVEFLQILLIALAKLVTDGLYKIGQLALVTARFGRKIVNLPQGPSIEARMPKYKFAQMGAP